MKLSLKFQGHHDQHKNTTQLMTAKVPITIFNNPFMSAISASTNTATTATANTNADFSFSLSTNFPSGPSLKLSYFPTTTASTATSSIPFSLSLKSGLGLLGSPRNSPLVFSANFTLSSSLTLTPSFFLHLKPQFGHFSLNKTLSSDPNTNTNTKPYSLTSSLKNNNDNNNTNNGDFSKVFSSGGSSSGWQELKLEPFGGRENTRVDNNIGFVPQRSLIGKNNEKRYLSLGVAVMARTVLPVTKGLLLNMRWGVNLPWDSGVKMPFLTVNKIGLERVVDDVKQNNNNNKGNETSESDLQFMKNMCFWMKRDLEVVEKENKEMKRVLEEMRIGVSTKRNSRDGSNGSVVVGRKLSSQKPEGSSDGSTEFERWRNKKNVREENEKKEQPKKQQQQSVVSDVESELEKAIKAAASASS